MNGCGVIPIFTHMIHKAEIIITIHKADSVIGFVIEVDSVILRIFVKLTDKSRFRFLLVRIMGYTYMGKTVTKTTNYLNNSINLHFPFPFPFTSHRSHKP